MRGRKLIIGLFLILYWTSAAEAQNKNRFSYAYTDSVSYELYLKSNWKELLKFGKEAELSGQNFPLLRLRMGYAAVMIQDYSEALKQYDAVLLKDSYNQTALYYNWYCRTMLNQDVISTAFTDRFSDENYKAAGIKKYALTAITSEHGYKITNVTNRENAIYNRISLQARLGWKVNFEQSFVLYNQTIMEPHLIYVENNQSISISQKEYYAKVNYAINHHLQLIGVYHYVNTPFNNYTYHNQIGLAGIQYYGYKMNVQADYTMARLTDTALNQINLQLKYYPNGNLNSYFISVFSFSDRNSRSRINFRETAGVKIRKNIWLEGNVTLNKFSNFMENDAMYVYNAIDANKFKAGMTLYLTSGKHLMVQAGYVFEKRELYNYNYIFNQNSINGGLTWKF